MNRRKRLWLWLTGTRWYYTCGRAILEIGGKVVAIEPELDREAIQLLGEGRSLSERVPRKEMMQ
jgi:hypothetical protein